MAPQKKFHLVFSLLMGVPVIFTLAPVGRKLTGRLLGMPV
jgi:hypothetical protein